MSLLHSEVNDFSVDAYCNGEILTISKEDIMGHWSIFFFYPADFSFVKPTELEDLSLHYEDFIKSGCELYAISTDTHWVHKAWHESDEIIGNITYPFLADPNGALSKAFDIYDATTGLAQRGDFIINPEGYIVAYEVTSSTVGRDASELLRRLKASQFVYEHNGQAEPSHWKPDNDDIDPPIDLVNKL